MKILRKVGAGALALGLAASAARAQEADAGHRSTQSYDDDAYIRAPVRFDKTFNQSLTGGCRYTVSVSGTVTPRPNQKDATVPVVTPHISVTAEAVCPREESVKVTDDVLGSGPLTWRQLAASLSSRARVYTVERHHQCTYGARFKVVDARLELSRFDHSCKAS
jgi:hypothetical protein